MEQINYYLSQLTFDSVVDILLVTMVIVAVLRVIRGTRAVQLLRGIIIFILLALVLVVGLSNFFELPALRWLIDRIFPVMLLAVPIIFQPELRRALERLGGASRYFRFWQRDHNTPMIAAIAQACLRLSQRRHGALIVLEQDTGLQEYIDTGIVMNAEPSPELFLTVFNKHTELHDGAVIVRGDKVAAAACVMPLSTSSLSDRQMGLRHRAALGISEVSDAVIIVVSEETGQVAIAHNGRILRRQDPTRLDAILQAFLQNRGKTQTDER